jgi:hypothetical protein
MKNCESEGGQDEWCVAVVLNVHLHCRLFSEPQSPTFWWGTAWRNIFLLTFEYPTDKFGPFCGLSQLIFTGHAQIHSIYIRYVYVMHLRLIRLFWKHYLTIPPFLHFTIFLESTTFAMTLNLLNKKNVVTAWFYEINSTCNNHHVYDQ